MNVFYKILDILWKISDCGNFAYLQKSFIFWTFQDYCHHIFVLASVFTLSKSAAIFTVFAFAY